MIKDDGEKGALLRMMRIKNNMDAVRTQVTLNKNSNRMQKDLKRVSSGMKINGAADDASGYAISERMRTKIRSLDQAKQNTQNGISIMKVAEGAVSSTVDILKTMKEKAINAANDTNTDSDRQTIQKEFNQFIDQIDDNANVTYNGKYLVDGSHNNGIEATATVLANDYLEEPANLTNNRKFTELNDRNGQSLGIIESDSITISLVQDAKTYTRQYDIGTNTLSDTIADFMMDIMNDGYKGEIAIFDSQEYYGYNGFKEKVAPAAGNRTTVITMGPKDPNANPPTIEDYQKGLEHQLGGITLSITDKDGQVKKSANAVLNQFHEVIRAQNASKDNALVFQVGDKSNQAIKVGLTDMRSQALALRGQNGDTVNIATQANANAAIEVLDNALAKALDQQTSIGAVQSRLAYTADNLTVASTNCLASESAIRDADMAKEMTAYTRDNVLLQAAQAMLSQANNQASSVLSLLQ